MYLIELNKTDVFIFSYQSKSNKYLENHRIELHISGKQIFFLSNTFLKIFIKYNYVAMLKFRMYNSKSQIID